MAMLRPLGIEKGQPFEPNARQQAFPGTQWDWVFYVKPRARRGRTTASSTSG